MGRYDRKVSNDHPPANRRIGRRDIVLLIIVFVILILVFAGAKHLHQDTGTEVVVTVDGKEYGRYPLASDTEIPITDGEKTVTNTLVIKNGKADMIDADCPDLLCVHQKSISHQGETIVCLPNKVVVSIEGGTEGLVDTVAQ